MMRDTSDTTDRRLAVNYLEAGQMLGVCERLIWQLVKDGELKAIRFGRAVRIPIAELERFVRDQSNTTPAHRED